MLWLNQYSAILFTGGAELYQEILLAFIVSIDIYLISIAYCNKDIKIPFSSAAVISLAGAMVMGFSLKLSDIICRYISPEMCHILSFAVLLSIGIITVLKSAVRNVVKKLTERGEISLKTDCGDLLIKLYLDDTAADLDNSKSLSVAEAFSLALAGSLDCAGMGLSCGYNDISAIRTAAFTFLAGAAALKLGNITGKKISSLDHDFSWLGGAFLIAFAFFEFFE